MTQAGKNFRAALRQEAPLLLPGAINPYCARMAERCGFKALYLSGGGVAASLGMPDLGITTIDDVAAAAAAITDACPLPLLVDADTGFGNWLNVGRATRALTRAGAAGMHLEDQEQGKRCGHRPNKRLASAAEMCDRLRAAADARADANFVLMARTDALACESAEQTHERLFAYREAGADMIFLEAAASLDDYRAAKAAAGLPLLANITEFGKTPLFTAAELKEAEVDMMLFPLSAFRAMNAAALAVYEAIRRDGSQKAVVDSMQTREELYDFLGYHAVEQKMDALFEKRESADSD